MKALLNLCMPVLQAEQACDMYKTARFLTTASCTLELPEPLTSGLPPGDPD